MGASGRGGRVLGGAVWVLTVLEALAMGGAGAAKFMGSTWATMFEGWGYPVAFTYVVGAAEIGGALLLLVPRTRMWGAGGLMVIMLGALATLTTTDYATGLGVRTPIVHLVVLSVLLWSRWTVRAHPAGSAP